LRQEANIAHADPLAEQFQKTLQSLSALVEDNFASQALLDFLSGDPQSFLEQMRPGFGDAGAGGANRGVASVPIWGP
jgi:hypothetical protein